MAAGIWENQERFIRENFIVNKQYEKIREEIKILWKITHLIKQNFNERKCYKECKINLILSSAWENKWTN